MEGKSFNGDTSFGDNCLIGLFSYFGEIFSFLLSKGKEVMGNLPSETQITKKTTGGCNRSLLYPR